MRAYYPQARAVLQVIFDGFGDDAQDSEPAVIPILPTQMRVTRNSYRQADSWELTFEANDLPIDPRLVRAGAAELFLFEQPGITDDQRVLSRATSFEDLANRRPRDAVDEVSLELALAGAVDRFTFGNRPIVAGLFDAQSLEFSGSGKWVTISGQDYTDFLIKQQWPPLANGRARRIPSGRRLDTLLREVLADADPEGRLSLVVENVQPSALPVVGANDTRTNRRGIPIKQETSYWDVMYKTASRHGFILFVRGLDVVLTVPQNLNNQYQSRIRRMAWGHNLESLELTRELGRETSPTVVVKSYDPATRQTITVDYPAGSFSRIRRSNRRAQQAGTRSVSIRKSDEYQIVNVYGITDQDTLRRMAETRYNLLGRPERKVRFRTKDLRDFEGNPILDLNSGDAFTIGFAEFNFELLADPRQPEGAKFNHLVSRGFGEAVSRVIAQSYTRLRFLERPLRLHEASLEYSVDDGITIEGQLVDFIVIDGVRDANAVPSARERRERRYQDRDGRTPGYTEDQRDAIIRESEGRQ